MCAWLLFLPTLLMVHNTVDFAQYGAQEAYVNILNCAVTDYIDLMEEHNDLRLINKWGEMDTKIRSLGLQFEVYTPSYPLNHARTMMVGLIDSFLDALNSSQRLIPYRPDPCGGPFTPNDIEIRVNFVDNCMYSYPTFGQVTYMVFRDGVISYFAGNTHCLGQLERLRDETYDFAKRVSPPLMQFIPPKCRP